MSKPAHVQPIFPNFSPKIEARPEKCRHRRPFAYVFDIAVSALPTLECSGIEPSLAKSGYFHELHVI